MKKSLALLALASALPLAAQSFEVSALYTWNKPKSGSFSGGGNSYDFTPDTWKAAGLRFGYTFAKVGLTEFQGNATIQFKNTQDYTLIMNGVTEPYPPGVPHLTEAYSYWAVGAAASWSLPVRLTAGLEYRSEKLDFSGAGLGASDQSSTYGRVWLRGGVGYDFKNSSPVTPFVAAEFAFPLTSTSPDYNQLVADNWESLSKGVAPKSQYGVNVGIRF
ncbi:MAG TPA: hypothetical protein VFT46_11850 [Holophagaceae bacterium]|nr:hypothetical protein [Holophagaceae bacterium]